MDPTSAADFHHHRWAKGPWEDTEGKSHRWSHCNCLRKGPAMRSAGSCGSSCMMGSWTIGTLPPRKGISRTSRSKSTPVFNCSSIEWSSTSPKWKAALSPRSTGWVSHATRLTDFERADANVKQRLAIIEERLTEVEKRLNFPSAQ